jgi:all-trans-retinol 13,14-reductase
MGSSKIVVMGSGMSGLFAGALLAREGLSVTVLEKEPSPGGLLTSFQRRGSWFDTGVHYLGSLAPGQVLWKYFNALDLFSLCQFDELDPNGFEEYRFPGLNFRLPRGWEAAARRLEEVFPKEKENLRACIRDWRRIAEHFPLYNLDTEIVPGRESEFLSDPQALMPLSRYLQERFSDERLRAVLSANNALYGIEPDDCPVYIHALIMDSFIQSAWRVRGSSRALCRALLQRLCEAGGEMKVRSRVTRLVTEGNRVRAAVLDSGEEITGDWFISTLHPKHMLGMLGEHAVRPIYRQRILSLDETISVFGLSLALSGNGVPSPRRNYFLHRSWDTGEAYGMRTEAEFFDPSTLFISPVESSPGYARTLSIMAPMDWSLWSRWEGTSRAHRPDDYQQAKAKVAQALIRRVEEVWPGVGAQVEFWDGATPLTFQDYTGTWQGSAYGLKKSCSRLREATLSVRTRLENLVLAGQSVVLPGIMGVTISAMAAAGCIVGFPQLIGRLNKS